MKIIFPHRSFTKFVAVLSFFIIVLNAIASPSSDFVPGEPFRPELVTTPPIIDGVLNEQFWKNAPHVTGFKTFLPDYGITPKEQTEVALAYDRENIYFAFRCYDDVTKIKASMSARDKMTADDFICINLDSFNDQQALTAFYVNPLGIQGDSRFAAGNEDFSPDFVWYSAGKIDSAGYTVEVQIPLKSLRYTNSDPTMMGVILERNISRRSEHSTFPELDPKKGFALLTQMYPISYSGIEHYSLFELLPAITATHQDARINDHLEREKQEGKVSLTAKYGLTSDLILDGTLNPDFSQIESDAGQVDVNLRYRLYNSEKRPFFLEGQDNFNIGANANIFDPSIYYSRNIVEPIAGSKLTGKIGNDNTVAVLYAMDKVDELSRPVLGDYVHVPIVRYKRTLSDDSYVGLLYTGKELDQTNNRVIGVDEQIRVSDAGVVESNGFLSWAKDAQGGPTLAGHSLGARYGINTRDLDFSISGREVSDNFRADMGFVNRTGLFNLVGFIRPKFYPKSTFFQRIELEIVPTLTEDRPSGLWETSNDFAYNIFFGGNWLWRTRLNYSTEVYLAHKFQTSGVHTQLRGQIMKEIAVSLLYRRTRSVFYKALAQAKGNEINAIFTLQPWENIQAEGSFTYRDQYRADDDSKIYDYAIARLKLTYQVNQYLFFRGIGEYNDFRHTLSTDFLASFTYIPGTAVFLGYGSQYEWNSSNHPSESVLLEMRRGLFLKMSYLWRS